MACHGRLVRHVGVPDSSGYGAIFRYLYGVLNEQRVAASAQRGALALPQQLPSGSGLGPIRSGSIALWRGRFWAQKAPVGLKPQSVWELVRR